MADPMTAPVPPNTPAKKRERISIPAPLFTKGARVEIRDYAKRGKWSIVGHVVGATWYHTGRRWEYAVMAADGMRHVPDTGIRAAEAKP